MSFWLAERSGSAFERWRKGTRGAVAAVERHRFAAPLLMVSGDPSRGRSQADERKARPSSQLCHEENTKKIFMHIRGVPGGRPTGVSGQGQSLGPTLRSLRGVGAWGYASVRLARAVKGWNRRGWNRRGLEQVEAIRRVGLAPICPQGGRRRLDRSWVQEPCWEPIRCPRCGLSSESRSGRKARAACRHWCGDRPRYRPGSAVRSGRHGLLPPRPLPRHPLPRSRRPSPCVRRDRREAVRR